MKWTEFGLGKEDPPLDKELLVYYENGPLDKGYVVCVQNSGCSWRFPQDKTYLMIKWCVIE